MTLAFRLSTVGSDVLDGSGLGVSDRSGAKVAVSVGVMLGSGGVAVSVAGETAVVAGRLVAEAAGAGVRPGPVKVQAKGASRHKMINTGFRFINEVYFPFGTIYTNHNELIRFA